MQGYLGVWLGALRANLLCIYPIYSYVQTRYLNTTFHPTVSEVFLGSGSKLEGGPPLLCGQGGIQGGRIWHHDQAAQRGRPKFSGISWPDRCSGFRTAWQAPQVQASLYHSHLVRILMPSWTILSKAILGFQTKTLGQDRCLK